MSKSTLFDPAQAGVIHLAGATQFSDAGIVSFGDTEKLMNTARTRRIAG